MESKEFNAHIQDQIESCTSMLIKKSDEYATDSDRLHNFKVAAVLEGVTIRQALAGMMAKHTVSIYDMCRSETSFVEAIWDEKITDHINYLLLLQAVVHEETKMISDAATQREASALFRDLSDFEPDSAHRGSSEELNYL